MQNSEINSHTEKSNIKSFQAPLKKYPLSNSIHLIDYFLIIGYEDTYIKEKIIKDIQIKDFPSANTNIYKSNNFPTILSSINSDYEGEIIDDERIIKIISSEFIDIYYNKGDNIDINLDTKNIIFSIIENGILYNGYLHLFYEGITLLNRIQIFIPKAFVIISQYHFYTTFYYICKEIHNLFYSNRNQIPLELQIYNIVNYTPVPIGKKLDVSLFPFYELNFINKCQYNEEFISLDEQKIYDLDMIKGYFAPQINVGEIFEIINIDLLVEIYLNILVGNCVFIFYKDIELLNIIIYLLNYFLFPLNLGENNVCISSKLNIDNDNKDSNLFNKEKYYYIFNQKNDNKNKNIFELNISKKSLTSNSDMEENIKKLGAFFKKYISENNNNNDNKNEDENNYKKSNLGEKIKELVINLKDIKEEIVRYDKTKYNFFELLNEKETEDNNHLIINSFYKFNLFISEKYYQYYLNKKNRKNNDNNDIIDEEKIFYELFSESKYSQLIKEEYDNNNYITKAIIENILNYKKKFNNNEKIESLDFYDSIYKPKENDKFEAVTFLNFYKYYLAHFQSYFYDIINNEYIECKNNRFYYKYKKINLDKNILLKYTYLLEQMPLEDKNKCFPYIENNIISELKTNIKYKDINNIFDTYLINNKIISYIDIIKYAILNIVILSLSGHKLVYFTDVIYELIKEINMPLNKYIEIMLSIAYRVFINEKNHNLNIYEKYFNIYDIVAENNLININSNINETHEKIVLFKDIIKDKSKEIVESNDYKSMKDSDIKKLYNLETKIKDKEFTNILLSNPSFNGNIKNQKINFKAKIIKDKSININDVFSPVKLHNNLNKIVDEYYQNLDFNKINKDEYRKMIIHLIYYCNLFSQEFNKGITKFLIYCLKIEKNKE